MLRGLSAVNARHDLLLWNICYNLHLSIDMDQFSGDFFPTAKQDGKWIPNVSS